MQVSLFEQVRSYFDLAAQPLSWLYAPIEFHSYLIIWLFKFCDYALTTALRAYFLVWYLLGALVLIKLVSNASRRFRARRIQDQPKKRGRSPYREPLKIAENEDDECLACRENEKNYLCIPCGHLSLCGTCKSFVTDRCPVCNAQLDAWQRLYK
jgi:hypothetical protein